MGNTQWCVFVCAPGTGTGTSSEPLTADKKERKERTSRLQHETELEEFALPQGSDLSLSLLLFCCFVLLIFWILYS